MIATIPGRRKFVARLLGRLVPQLTDRVHILLCTDKGWIGGGMQRGEKRQYMLEQAKAPFVSFVDDDDLVSEDYCQRVLDVIDRDGAPDIVGFRLRHFVNGTMAGYGIHSYNALKIAPPPNAARGWDRHDRQPNHLNPVRRSLALKAGYRDLHFGEDGDYSRRLASLKPRPTEVFVDATLYEYLDRPQKREGE